MTVDNYIFDLYGTLVDIRTNEKKQYLWDKTALFMSLQGANYTGNELKNRYNELVNAEIIGMTESLGTSENADYIEPDLLNVFKKLYSEKKANSLHAEETALFFRSISMTKLELYPHAAEVLDKLHAHGHKVYLLTNAQEIFTVPELKKLRIYDKFDKILISSQAGVKKPSDLFYNKLIDECNLDVSRTVMVGNDPVCDCMGAHDVGMRSIYIETEQSPKENYALPNDCTQIVSLSELLEM